MNKLIVKLYSLIGAMLCVSCGALFNQPLDVQNARIGEITPQTSVLKSIPEPTEQIIVGVYKFRDQTGQYKPSESGASWSTAVTQGGTSILIKALEDSKWFKPIERENIGNLLNERQIIRSTHREYAQENGQPDKIPIAPLLFAPIIIEGGIVSYDTNIITGGAGARYFGAGGSTRYRQDRITLYLRVVSTSSGEILNTVYVSKTILSQSIDVNLFRYVNFKRLLEVETGISRNEPVQLAVKEAIEKAVESIIVEGIDKGVWSTKAGVSKNKELVDAYNNEKAIADKTTLYERNLGDKRTKNVFQLSAGGTLLDGDYPSKKVELMPVKVGYKRYLTDYFNLGLTYSKFNLGNRNVPGYESTYGYMTFDLNGEVSVLPYDDLSPFVYAGIGYNVSNYFEEMDPKAQYGLGLEYLISKRIGVKLYAEQNFVLSDELDRLSSGKRDDFYWRFGAGINLYVGKNSNGRAAKRAERKKLKSESKVAEKELKRLKKQQKKDARKNK